MKPDDPRLAAIERAEFACPLACTTRPMLRIESGPAGVRRRCPRCGVVAVFPRVALATAIRRMA